MNTFQKADIYLILILTISIFGVEGINGQSNKQRLDEISTQLDQAQSFGEPINKPITITMNGPIQEFVTFLAESTNLNISIDPAIKQNISVSFTDAVIKDVILYLCDAYDLEVKLTGTIIRLSEYIAPLKKKKYRPVDVTYDKSRKALSMNLRNDTLDNVVRKVIELTGQNVVVDPVIRNLKMNGYINRVAIPQAIEQLAANNGLTFEEKDGVYYLKEFKQDAQAQNVNARNKRGSSNNSNNKNGANSNGEGTLFVKKIGGNQVTINAIDVPIEDLIIEVADKLSASYYLLPNVDASNRPAINNQTDRGNNRASTNRTNTTGRLAPEDLISTQLTNVDFNDVLDYISKNSAYTYEVQSGVPIVGKRIAEELRAYRIYQLQNRSARGVIDFIPEEMQSGVEIDSLYELNSLILSGSQPNIEEITDFIMQVDKLVPVVLIELVIVDVQTNRLNEVGVQAGVEDGGKPGGGTLISGDNPNGLDYNLSTGVINQLLRLLTGTNLVNLGQVNSNFYLSLKAMEEDGVVEIESTPKLTTMNSHPAILNIGETRYYQEQQVNFPGSDRPIPVQSNRFQSVDANLSIEIVPFVSGDEQVTLQIYFEQSEFIAFPENAPPPQVTRQFESMLRVANGETVVLGGLERDSNSKTSRGIPFLSRIPVIGALFGKRRKNKSKNKLIVFVKATIIS